MTLLNWTHDRVVHSWRVEALRRNLAPLLPAGASILDVGCGDGFLSRRLAESRPDCRLEGIDVLPRPVTQIPTTPFDGRHLPYSDKSIDIVMFVDVLHHTDDPFVLLSEARRVARHGIVIKDHARDGFMAGATLRFMDRVGNAHHGVALPYNYWTREDWHNAFGRLNLTVECWHSQLNLYPAAIDWIFGRSLHFTAMLRPTWG